MINMFNSQGEKYLCVNAQLYLTLCNPMDCSLPSSSVNGISQARILEWVAFFFCRGSSLLRDWTHISVSPGLAGGFSAVVSSGKNNLWYRKGEPKWSLDSLFWWDIGESRKTEIMEFSGLSIREMKGTKKEPLRSAEKSATMGRTTIIPVGGSKITLKMTFRKSNGCHKKIRTNGWF